MIARSPVDYARRRLAARQRDSQRQRAWLMSDEPPESFMRSRGVTAPALSGMYINSESAIRVTTVLSAVKVIAESVATLPLMMFERLEKGDRKPAWDHPLTELLHDLPNEETSAETLRGTKLAHTLLRGTGLARIVRDGGGDVRELWNLDPNTVYPRRPKPGGPLVYEISETGRAPETLKPHQVWRVPGFSWNGITGLSPIGFARETMGVSLALERNTSAAMSNGARISGGLTFPGALTDPQFDEVSASFKETFAGPDNAGKVMVVPHGGKFTPMSMTFEDLQFLELKQFQVAEIARIFRVPLHMLFDGRANPRANMEQASLEFVMYTLRPWLVRIEQSIYRDLLLPSERGRYFAEHNVAGLLRGDFSSRMAGYSQARQWGWLSVNDIRRLENLNGIGGDGDVYLQPSNMVPAGDVPPPPAPKFDEPTAEEPAEPAKRRKKKEAEEEVPA